jgi:hypothetical protein
VTFRAKLFWIFTLALILAIAFITAGVTVVARKGFDESNAQHSDALVAQFQREFVRRGQDVARRVQGIANAEGTVRMAIDLARPSADPSIYVADARGVAQSYHLDILDFVNSDGTIISSAEYRARFGYKMEWLLKTADGKETDWLSEGPFLTKIDTQDGPALALLAVSTVRVGVKNLYIVGGERLGKEFLASTPTSSPSILSTNPVLSKRLNASLLTSRECASTPSSKNSKSTGRPTGRMRRFSMRFRCAGVRANSSAYSSWEARSAKWLFSSAAFNSWPSSLSVLASLLLCS